MENELTQLARRVGEALSARGLTVVTAESCTGGWIGKALTDIPGSSSYVWGGWISYSNQAKQDMLGVPLELIDRHGAVSEPVVVAMAEGALRQSGTDLSVAVSGVAGPDGGTAEKPVGTVWIAWRDGGGRVTTRCLHLDGDREAVRRETVRQALAGLLALVAP